MLRVKIRFCELALAAGVTLRSGDLVLSERRHCQMDMLTGRDGPRLDSVCSWPTDRHVRHVIFVLSLRFHFQYCAAPLHAVHTNRQRRPQAARTSSLFVCLLSVTYFLSSFEVIRLGHYVMRSSLLCRDVSVSHFEVAFNL
jgi:hypothetical protein